MSDKPTFERAADAALADTRAIYSQRGDAYQDTWAIKNQVTTLTRATLCRLGVSLDDEALRLVLLAALIDVKDSRVGAGGPWNRDSMIDGVAYRSCYTTLREEYERSHPP